MTSADAQTGLRLPLAGPALLRALADNWWVLLLRGIASVAFGCLAFVWPGLTLLTLTFLWGGCAGADGVFALWAAVSGQGGDMAPRWWLAVVGITGTLAGVLTFVWPGMTAHRVLRNGCPAKSRDHPLQLVTIGACPDQRRDNFDRLGIALHDFDLAQGVVGGFQLRC